MFWSGALVKSVPDFDILAIPGDKLVYSEFPFLTVMISFIYSEPR